MDINIKFEIAMDYITAYIADIIYKLEVNPNPDLEKQKERLLVLQTKIVNGDLEAIDRILEEKDGVKYGESL